MKLYKVMNEDLTSPYQGMQYEIGKKYVCDNFDASDKECSDGFYAVDFTGLVYAINSGIQDHDVWEVEVAGKSKEFNKFKRRFSEITFTRKLSHDEVVAGLEECRESEGYDTVEACFPVNPFKIEPTISLDEAVGLLVDWKKVRESVRESFWDSVWGLVRDSVMDSVWDSVWGLVWDSVWGLVWDSVRESVRESVWESVYAYISSLFPHITKWKYVEHEEGVNPFQSSINLWRAGYVAIFDGKKWMLHTKDGIVWEDV